jgi:hypothetical protein
LRRGRRVAPAAIDCNLQAEQIRDRVVDLLGVVPADRDIAEQAAEEPGTRLGDLVQGE